MTRARRLARTRRMQAKRRASRPGVTVNAHGLVEVRDNDGRLRMVMSQRVADYLLSRPEPTQDRGRLPGWIDAAAPTGDAQ